MKTKTVKLGGRRWRLRYVPRLGDSWGECDPPTASRKEIRISREVAGEKELEILIHEMLHALNWTHDETHVEQSAVDIARTLWRIGFRKLGDE